MYRILLVLLVITLVYSVAEALLDNNTQQRVDAICKQTIDTKFCQGVFAKKLATSSPSNKDLLNVTVTEAERFSANTYFFISTLLRDAGDERSGLQKCAEAYEIVNTAFTEVVSFFNQGLYGEILKLTGKVSYGVGICKTDFNVPGYHINPLKEKNIETKVLVAMEKIIGHMISSESNC
ncbi:Plant invertase/pectin methylesterase inhibitor superfamily protein [Raphanus sativus]|nr:Plant invertase/pectin methylesterase inhibitor superfamily protein [Raphanus sativus]